MLNNGVFGETGGHMTATTVLGQRTKNTLEGRNAGDHGYPILLADLIAQLDGAAYVARGAVNSAGERGPHQEDAAPGARDPAGRRRVLLRRDPDHVPDRVVHRDAGGPDYLADNLGDGARARGAEGRRSPKRAPDAR